MQKVSIEWKHFDEHGQTCNRCASTGAQVEQAVRYLKMICPDEGVTVAFKETQLAVEALPQSNILLFDGVPIEDVLPNASLSYNSCDSCQTLSERALATCRTVERDGERHDSIPAELIVEAACHSVGDACCSRK